MLLAVAWSCMAAFLGAGLGGGFLLLRAPLRLVLAVTGLADVFTWLVLWRLPCDAVTTFVSCLH